MSFLEYFGFEKDDISEFVNNTPKKITDVLEQHVELVKENLGFIKDLGITTYKEIFINYPDMFLMDASNFAEMFTQYEREELIEKLNANFKMVKYL